MDNIMATLRWTLLGLLLAAVVVTLPGCSSAVGPEEVVLILEVDARTETCTGEMVQTCLRVRAPGESEWRLFYDPIEGFVYEPGFRYLLEVARRSIPDPPMDGSSYAYRLIEVLSREPVNPS